MNFKHKIANSYLLKNLYLAFSLSIFSFSLFAQINKDGIPIIRKYSPEEYNAHQQNWAIIKDNRGVMYFANNHGLLEYNGAKWSLFDNANSQALRSLAVDKNGRIYYGASQDFGVLVPDSLGNLKHFSLYKAYSSEEANFNTIWRIQVIDNTIFFQANEGIYTLKLPFDTSNPEIIKNNITFLKPENAFHWSFNVRNKFYVREVGKGIMVADENKLKLIPGSEIFADEKIYVMLPYKENKILICSRESGLYIYDPEVINGAFSKLICETNNILIESFIYSGSLLPNNKFAISTLTNGVIIIDESGSILEHFNEKSGLPDQMILSMYYDDDIGKLWFASAENGIFNANIGSPFREWNRDNGLNGIVSDIIRYKEKVYVATSNGVFYLEESKPAFSVFEPVSAISYESWDFLHFVNDKGDDKLLVATIKGVYEIDGKKVKLISEGYIYQLLQSSIKRGRVYVGYSDGFGAIDFNEKTKKWIPFGKNESINNIIRCIYEKESGEIYLGTQFTGIIKLNDIFDNELIRIDTVQGLPIDGSEFRVYQIDNEIVFATMNGLFKYNERENKVYSFDKFGDDLTNGEIGVYNVLHADDNYWLSLYSNNLKKSIGQSVVRYEEIKKDSFVIDEAFSKSIPQKVAHTMYNDGDYLWIANDKGLYKYNKKVEKKYNEPYNIHLFEVTTTDDSVLFAGTYFEVRDSSIFISLKQIEDLKPKLEFRNNQISFEYSALFYEQEEATQYRYRLIGQDEKWSKWNIETKHHYNNLREGNYRFEIVAKNVYGTISKITSYEFVVSSPWYRTFWAYIMFGLTGILLIWLIVKLNIRRLQFEKERLEVIVKDRTKEIRMKNVELEQQKEEIMAQRDEIEAQRDFVTHQKEQIEIQHDKIVEQKKSITDSIHYASKIQAALLPPKQILNENLPEHFILYKPRDIVSGDFYWSTKKNNKTVIVAADCTGHGVPGAFMSMLGISYLNQIINKFDKLHANQILNELKASVKKSLRQTGKDDEAKDGMDMSLCIIDYEKMQMEFAGAYNSLLLIRNNEIIKYDADRMPIGIYIRELDSFTNHIIDMQKDDNFYIYSDGYIDQFGGNKGAKLMTKTFKELLLQNHQKSVAEQKIALEVYLKKWQSYLNDEGEPYNQVDDILVVGIKI